MVMWSKMVGEFMRIKRKIKWYKNWKETIGSSL